eukprot:s1139_g21.t1
MSLALSADPQSMAQAAKYYEQRGQPQKAVILYQKAGQQKRALELCFSARLFDALRKIADDLSAESVENLAHHGAPATKQEKPRMVHYPDEIEYSERYQETDDRYEYRHVILNKQAAKEPCHVVQEVFKMTGGGKRFLHEDEWRGVGVQQSRGWVHYEFHRPEPHILLFRRPVGTDPDPAILAKCAEFFMQHEQHDKAVHLLSISKQYDRAVQLCTEHDVHITEDMAERMTPDKGSMDATSRSEILQEPALEASVPSPRLQSIPLTLAHACARRTGTSWKVRWSLRNMPRPEDIAKLCKKQGSFQLACKKFTQAGDKLKAMKSLLNSGDTEKIIFFAGTARQPDIYVLAGNYLQSLDWHADPDIMKNIIQFYSKAKAYDKLASFYDACAQVEIDEYRDYEKAGGALREALKYMAKAAGDTAESDERVISLQSRIALVDEFAGVRKMAKTEPDQMVAVCERMVSTPNIDSAVRTGDIFAQLVEYYTDFNDYNSAYRTVERMREHGIVLTPYLDRALLERIYGAVGQPLPESEAAPAAPAADGEDVDEEIAEED